MIRLLMSFGLLAGAASAQRTDAMFDQNCASCHEVGAAATSAKSPDRRAINKLTTGGNLRIHHHGLHEG